MPLGEEIGEVVLRVVIEIVFHVVFYGVGYLFLKILSFGNLPLASFSSLEDRNPSEKKTWTLRQSIWLKRREKGRILKAECVILAGTLVAVAISVIWYLAS